MTLWNVNSLGPTGFSYYTHKSLNHKVTHLNGFCDIHGNLYIAAYKLTSPSQLLQSQHKCMHNSAFKAQLCSAKSHHKPFQSQHCIHNSAFKAQLCSAKSHTQTRALPTKIHRWVKKSFFFLHHAHLKLSQQSVENWSSKTCFLKAHEGWTGACMYLLGTAWVLVLVLFHR